MTKKQLRQHRLKKQAEQNITRGAKTSNELRDEAFRQLYDEPIDGYYTDKDNTDNDL